jgi:putative membrane protein
MLKFLVWLGRVLVFFVLFAFAINNRQEVALHWFFGYAWRAEMVLVVLTTFAAGCAVGIVAMLPAWWKYRSIAKAHQPDEPASELASAASPTAWNGLTPDQPPRDGL